jgi:NADP-dependent 3-hydroxy acid dehydrogenase YdfG
MDGFSHERVEKVIPFEATEVRPSRRFWQVVLDVTDEENRRSVINKVLRESGRIDILVNNAGICVQVNLLATATGRQAKLISSRSNLGCGPGCCPQGV